MGPPSGAPYIEIHTMPKQFVADLVPNAKVSSPFAVRDKTLLPFRSKPGKYLSLALADRTGTIPGRVWDNAEEIAARFDPGDVVMVSGRVEHYQGQAQVVINDVVKLEPEQYNLEDFVPRSPKSREELLGRLRELVAEVSHPHLRALLDAFMADEQFLRHFAEAYGSKSLHHAYVGGLLEHTLSVVEILKTVAAIHPELDRDLLITGGLLHDIGKIYELDGALAPRYTDVGHFVGHTVLTDRMVQAKLAQVSDFPPHLADLLCHMLLSHHGEKEWGAPVVPVTMEACALHYADNLDARVQGFKHVIQSSDPSVGWSNYHRSYQRAIYLGTTQQPPASAEQSPPADPDYEASH